MKPVRLALVGLGKIARTEHVPALRADTRFELIATVDPTGEGLHGIQHVGAMEALEGVDAVAICTPPAHRHDLAQAAIGRGWHVLLEKPPAATVEEVEALRKAASARGISLFAAWHSRFAPGVAPARRWLVGRQIKSVRIIWREDVRAWHPGQDWIWEHGGFGVFDPGINAFSIATEILQTPLKVQSAELFVPSNRAAPIAAQIEMVGSNGAPVTVDLDWRQTGAQTWEIIVETASGALALRDGGARLEAEGADALGDLREYPALYRRFAELVGEGRSDVDSAPLALALACLNGRVTATAPFID